MFKIINNMTVKDRLKLSRILSITNIGFVMGYMVGAIPMKTVRNILYVVCLFVIFIPQIYIILKEEKRLKKELAELNAEYEMFTKDVESRMKNSLDKAHE